MGLEDLTILGSPFFFREVMPLKIDLQGTPIALFPRHIITTFQDQYLESRRSEPMG
jgi:hypothetical protein